MRIRRVLPPVPDGEPDLVRLGEDGVAERLDGWLEGPSAGWTRLNLVASIDGSARGADGTSESLTNRADRAILGALRRAADVVLVGAETARRERYLLPKRRPLAVLTRTGELGDFDPAPSEGRLILLCADPTTALRERADRWGARLLSGDPADPLWFLEALRADGHTSIVCEGGPALAAHLLDAGAVDEICLTIAPMLAAAGLPVLPVATPQPMSLSGLLADDEGYLYCRWTRRDG